MTNGGGDGGLGTGREDSMSKERETPLAGMERHTGFEPAHPAWKAGMLTVKHQCRIGGVDRT